MGKDTLTLKASVLLHKKNTLDLTDIGADLVDDALDLLGWKVKLQLVSEQLDPATGSGKRSAEVAIGKWYLSLDGVAAGDVKYELNFTVDKDFGPPAAFFIKNNHHNEFFLISLSLLAPDNTAVYFPCNSWIFNVSKYTSPRVFFKNQVYLPEVTPPGLKVIREKELESIRGSGTGQRTEGERIYDFDVYNDLGNPDSNKALSRPVLGGSKLPYPRRVRTGRNPTRSESHSESLPGGLDDVYLPADESYGKVGYSSFLGDSLKAAAHKIVPAIKTFYENDTKSFDSLEEIKALYSEGIELAGCVSPESDEEAKQKMQSAFTLIGKLTATDDTNTSLLQYPLPQLIKANADAWMTDDEFARQSLAGLNPMIIKKLDHFPPTSNLDPAVFGPAASALKQEHIQNQLQGLTVEQALQGNRLFVLDYHDAFLPYISRINAQEKRKIYASRTILFLTNEGTLKLVAIELSLPSAPEGGQRKNRVFLPPSPSSKKDWLWNLAKAHVSVNDCGYHQLVSHWMKTHAVIEPFIISTYRQLSAMHPLHLLLHPHYKNTMNINAKARKALINAGGIIEDNFTPGKYSMELSAVVYGQWRFDQEGLPADLIRRGMAVPNDKAEHGLELRIKDYPYAVDGLNIWAAIKSWVQDYTDIFYKDDATIKADKELQSWWNEARNVGHADKKDADWWLQMDSKGNLVEVLTTIIWLASAHHAAVNFGQYAYAGYPVNRPTMGHRLVPEEGTPEFKEFQANPEKFYLSALSSKVEATTVMTTIEILSTHAVDEEYLGERKTPNWTSNELVLAAFEKLKAKIDQAEKLLMAKNKDKSLKNRHGDVNLAYTLLCVNSKPGLTGRGVPNSISI